MNKFNCYCCKQDKLDFLMSEYELKKGGKVDICCVCENTTEYYFDVIKRDCLIDGKSLDLTRNDRKTIEIERRLRLEKEDEERQLDCDKSIFYFTNEPLKKPEYNHQVLRYVNGFIGEDESDEDHIQRFKFNQSIGKHWHIGEWNGLDNVHIYLDEVKKEYQKVKKPEETEWRDRVRKWYSGRFESDESLYNCTFGFSQYDDQPCGEVWASYDFICSKRHDVEELIRDTLIKDGWNFE